MTTSEKWTKWIEHACAEPNLALCNHEITLLHYALSEALAERLGREGGPNFHSWAVWGSKKAGVTIRQEDLDGAVGDATWTAAILGGIIGAVVGVVLGREMAWSPDLLTAAIGAGVGSFTGGCTGKQIAVWSRDRAAKLVLQGNQTVLRDIGGQSARFLELLEEGAPQKSREMFFSGLRKGPTEQLGQDHLKVAFKLYLAAFDSTDAAEKREKMIAGNCEIVYHEHLRLEPYIRGAMPWIVRRCATQRLMTFEIGEQVLTVGEDLPGVSTPTAAKNWAKIEERMRYVFALFRKFHEAPEVFAMPYPVGEMNVRSLRAY